MSPTAGGTDDVATNVAWVRDRIADAARRAGRDPASVRLTNGSGRGTPLATVKSKSKKATADGGWDTTVANLNGDSLRDLKLGFSRSALIANGDLNGNTTSLTLTGRAGASRSCS